MDRRKKKYIASAGLDYKHKQQRQRLLAKMPDGTPCWWCGEPMFKKPEKNFDGKPLQADHEIARRNGGKIAGRLLHARCNASRGTGERDHLRPALVEAAFDGFIDETGENADVDIFESDNGESLADFSGFSL